MSRRSAVRFGESIDDGQHGPYKHHFVCFECRKVFEPHFPSPFAEMERCPDCGGELWDCGPHFRGPKRRDRKAWEALRKRVTHGATYERGDPRRRGLRLLRRFEKRR